MKAPPKSKATWRRSGARLYTINVKHHLTDQDIVVAVYTFIQGAEDPAEHIKLATRDYIWSQAKANAFVHGASWYPDDVYWNELEDMCTEKARELFPELFERRAS